MGRGPHLLSEGSVRLWAAERLDSDSFDFRFISHLTFYSSLMLNIFAIRIYIISLNDLAYLILLVMVVGYLSVL